MGDSTAPSIKMSKDPKFSHNNKQRLQKKLCERYQSLSKEEKEIKQRYGCQRYKNLPEDEKEKLVAYRTSTIR